ncbi:VWA domain-containing protein [Shimia abyssi]|uniref:Ca-activated chloride channel family protein n=1 Tax=Shimia abyssi TaxID=1662395 RepID=A0A2P8FJY3_9RHOB|nr:VWA domain-containing protein [Shimia abyssi]PSL21998.1 Ca-activated chloride channel family protein [Shimia abyssi]
MTPFETALSAFHFIRPAFLLTLIPLALLWWRIRRPAEAADTVTLDIAPHLKSALTIGAKRATRFHPIDLVTLVLTLLTLAASGPTWSRVPEPFAAQTAPMVIALQVTPSMQESDLAPSRLERAKQKIRDLLEMRAGARTALIAYSGTAHSAVPMTDDSALIQPYLEGLSPEIMPVEGTAPLAALALAQDILQRDDNAGGVLFLLDDISTSDATQLAQSANGTPLAFLTMLPNSTTPSALSQVQAQTVAVTPDTADLRALERGFQAAYQQAQLQDAAQPWQDRGAWLAWPAAFLLLFWFRRGVTMRWALLFALAMSIPPERAQAQGVSQSLRDWFFTPDQQGWLAYRKKDYAIAADRFADPYARGVAQYRAGQYEAAAQSFAQLDTADAAFAAGMAYVKSRGYRNGVRAFERALEIDPTHQGANNNLPIAKQIVDFVETQREQSDTGEDSGIGADDVVFDNEAQRGAETELSAPAEDKPSMLTADQWMNTVDTATSDFLLQRFRLEASEASQ